MTFKIDTAALAAGLAHMPLTSLGLAHMPLTSLGLAHMPLTSLGLAQPLTSLGLAQPPSVTASFKCRQPQLQLAALEMLLVHNACVRELLAATVNVH